jgi:hypothetical protein
MQKYEKKKYGHMKVQGIEKKKKMWAHEGSYKKWW